MGSWDAHIPRLDARSHLFIAINTSAVNNATLLDHSSIGANATKALIADLQLAQVQSVRTANIVAGSFSLALALITVYRIISDARRVAALQVLPRKKRFNWSRNVHTAEVFPLALACSAVLQQILIIGAQSTTLYSIYSMHGRVLAMVTLPAIFLFGYTTLVFGIEMAWRAFGRERFTPRGKWNTIICIGAVSTLELLTWIQTVAFPSAPRAFGGLIFFTATRFDFLSFVILCVLVSLLLLLAAFISIQLMRTPDVDPNERISATRMTIFLVFAAIIYTLVIPVELLSYQRQVMRALSAAVVAEASLFSTGIVITFVHLFLRANATRMVIRPINEMKAKTPTKRPRFRIFGPSDLEMNISGPMALQTSRRPESRQGLIDVGPEKNRGDFEPEYFESRERVMTPTSANSFGSIDPTKWPLPPDMDEKTVARYSLFPTRAEDVPRLPATVYRPNAGPESPKGSRMGLRRFTSRSSITNVSEAFDFLTKPRHRHQRSTDSIATVQIGLRFSLGPAILAAPKGAQVENILPPSLKRNETGSSGESLQLPIQSPTAQTTSGAYLQAQREKVLPSPASSPPPPPAPRSLSPPGPPIVTGLRMSPLSANPPTPTGSVVGSPVPSRPGTPGSMTLSPTARIPLGAGTMSRSTPRTEWV